MPSIIIFRIHRKEVLTVLRSKNLSLPMSTISVIAPQQQVAVA